MASHAEALIDQVPYLRMDHVVAVAEGTHVHGIEGGDVVDGVDHHPAARRAVPAEFADLAPAADGSAKRYNMGNIAL